MDVEDTLDPSNLQTRKVDSMSEIVAEMVLGECGEEDSAATADAAALAAARHVAIEGVVAEPAAPALQRRPRARLFLAAALGAFALVAGVATVVLVVMR